MLHSGRIPAAARFKKAALRAADPAEEEGLGQ